MSNYWISYKRKGKAENWADFPEPYQAESEEDALAVYLDNIEEAEADAREAGWEKESGETAREFLEKNFDFKVEEE